MTKIFFIILIFFYNITFAQKGIKYFFKAQALTEYNNFSAALNYIDTAIKINSDNQIFIFQKAIIYYKSKDYKNAKKIFSRLSKKGNKDANLYLAKIYAYSKQVDSSILFLEKYLQSNKKISRNKIILDTAFIYISNTTQWNKLWSKKWYTPTELKLQEAIFYLENKQYIQALDIVNQLITKNKKNYKAYFLKGVIFQKLKNHKNAIKNFSKAIKIYPSNYTYYNYRACSYSQIKKYKKAIADYEKSVKINPYQIKLYPSIAEIYNKIKNYNKALFYLNEYLKYYTKDVINKFLLAQIYYNSGNYLNTINILNQIFDTYPNKAKLYLLRGMAYMQSNSYSLAVYDLSQALDLNPTYSKAYVYKGICYLKMKKIDLACQQWDKAMEKHQYMANKYYYQYCQEYDKLKFEK